MIGARPAVRFCGTVEPMRTAVLVAVPFVLAVNGCAEHPGGASPPRDPQYYSTSPSASPPAMQQPSSQAEPSRFPSPAQSGSTLNSADQLRALKHEMDVAELNLSHQLDSPTADAAREEVSSEVQPGTPSAASGVGSPTRRAAAPKAAAAPEELREGGRSPCALACKALGSMKRSSERICELTDAHHPECENAQRRVGSAAQRVDDNGCACSIDAVD